MNFFDVVVEASHTGPCSFVLGLLLSQGGKSMLS